MIDLIQRPTGIFFVTVALVAAGILCGTSLSTSMYPQIQKPTIQVWMPFPGVTSQELFALYERDVQESLRRIEDTLDHRVEYASGHISAQIDFDFNKDRDLAKQETILAFETFKAKLPLNNQRSMWIGYWDNGQGIFVAGISSTDKNRTFSEIYKTVRPAIEEPIMSLKEVDAGGNTGISNFDRKEVVIEFKEMNLVKYGLFLPDVIDRLRQETNNIPAGQIVSDTKSVFIRTIADKTTVEDFENIIVDVKTSGPHNKIVRLAEIAEIKIEPIPPHMVWRVNSRPSLMVFASAKPGGNLLNMAEGVKNIIEKAQQDVFSSDVFYEVFLDPAKYIRDAVANMMNSALLGTLIATLIILLFFGQFRSTLLIAISIPTTVFISFIFMKFFDVNINMISLGGMALAVGMIVDSSIVVLENIYRQFELQNPSSNDERIKVIAEACREVGLPVVVSTLTSVIVFLPLSQTSAMTHAILGDMSKVVVFALVISIAVSLILLPALTRFFVDHRGSELGLARKWNAGVAWIANCFYRRLILAASRTRRRASIISLGLFAVFFTITWLLADSIKKEIIAEPEPSIFEVDVDAKFINDRDKLFEAIRPFEEILISDKYNQRSHIVSRARRGNSAQIFVLAKDAVDIKKLQKDIEIDIKTNTDFEIHVNPWNPTSLPLPEINDVLVEVRPTEPHLYADAIKLCEKIDEALGDEEVNAWCNPWMSRPEEILIHPYKSKLAHLANRTGRHISAYNLADLVKIATHEQHLGEVRLNNQRVDVLARYPEKEVSSLEKVKNLLLGLGNEKNGRPVIYNLSTLAAVESSFGESNIVQKNERASVVLEGRLNDEYRGSQAAYQKKVQDIVNKVQQENPTLGAVAIRKNPYEDVDKSVGSLMVATLISLILILTLLVVQFQSIKQALIIMAAIPLGVFGVMISLFVFNSTISINSMLGIILLAGIAVNNSILIMDFYNKIKAEKQISAREAVIEAVAIRFRPIMMTMLTTILAMLPIALNLGTGGRTLQPLGVAISGGLLSSTIFTLLIVPLLIFIFENKTDICAN